MKINFLHLLGVTNTRSQTHFYNMHANTQPMRRETSHAALHQVPFKEKFLRKSLLATIFSLFKLNCCPGGGICVRAACNNKKAKATPIARERLRTFKKALKFPFLCAHNNSTRVVALCIHARCSRAPRRIFVSSV